MIAAGNAEQLNSNEVVGAVPVSIEAGYSYGLGEADRGRTNLRSIVKVEINFGDSPLWIDCTSESHAHWRGDPPPAQSNFDHTYTQPGEFLVEVRLTFWDGEVLNSLNKCKVTVSPPAGA